MKVPAHARYVRQSPQKVRAVLDTVRGLPVPEAMVNLAYTDRRAAGTVKKVLESAVANALENHDIPAETWSSPRPSPTRGRPSSASDPVPVAAPRRS